MNSSIILLEGSMYFLALPSEIVSRSLPPHRAHLPMRGILLYFSLQVTHLKPCFENFRKLPLMSRRKCFESTASATLSSSTARSFLSRSSCANSFSSIVSSCVYLLRWGPSLMSYVSCVNFV